MNAIVTFEQLVNICDAIEQNVKISNSQNELLGEDLLNYYDILNERKKLLKLFDNFKSAKYLYKFPVSNAMRITPTYESKEICFQKSSQSQIEKAVEKYVDKQILTTEIYNTILDVSSRLTNSECVYLINTFFQHKSEESIAEIIGISKTYLQRIKKSCIVKNYIFSKICYIIFTFDYFFSYQIIRI